MLTEDSSKYQNLETFTTAQLLHGINDLDSALPAIVNNAIPQIEKLCDALHQKMQNGGRLFYIGSGTSGRLGIVDASECPPTYGVPHGMVVGIISGGDNAIRKAVEFAEDDTQQGFKDLQQYQINDQDFVVGISASGRTPYVLGALQACAEQNIATGCIVCNPNSIIAQNCNYPIEVPTGGEFVRGSTRMKAGTATKLVLNMITTTTMIKLGRVVGNKMVDMQLSNNKLVDRGTRMIMEETKLDYQTAQNLLLKHGSVRMAIVAHSNTL